MTTSPSFKNIILLSLIVICIWAGFIFVVDVDVLRSDQFPWVLEFESFMNGELGMASLWEAKGGHRLPGYKLLFFLNAWVLGFSPQIESVLAIIPFSIVGVWISVKFSKSFNAGHWIQRLILAAFLFLWFNGQAFLLSYYSLVGTQLFDYAGFVILAAMSFNLAQRESLPTPKRSWLLYCLCVFVVILMFGRGYGVAASAAIIVLCVIGLLKNRGNRNFIGIIAILTLAIAIYMAGISRGGSAVSGGFNLVEFSYYVPVKLGNAYLGMANLWNASEIAPLALAIGIIVLALKSAILIGVIRQKTLGLYDWLALFFILMGIFSLLLVAVARYNVSPFYPRHNLEISIASIGLLFFVLKFLSELKSLKAAKFLTIGITGSIVLFLALHHFQGVKYLSAVTKYYEYIETLQADAYRAERALTKKEYQEMKCKMRPDECHQVFEIMRKRGISKRRLVE